MSSKISILLADDHGVLRAGLKALLDAEPTIEVVGEAETGEEALKKAKELKPDIVVMDLSMPGMGGLEATRRVAALDQGTKVLVLTMHAEEDFLLPVLDAGGSGFVRKTSADEDLTEAIRTVARGEVFLYPSAARLLLERYKHADADELRGPLDKLTERERDVLAMTAEGFSSTEIGEKLFISPKTVDTYRSRIMDKLQIRHRSELVRFALQTGLLRVDD
ncbi:MAG TPA: response regulator transcription factor [Longimicrobiales bacterium]|nr:response regulator transcription factor [Longimicrobiales bacterium]